MAEGHVSLQLAIVLILVDIASLQTGTGMTMQNGAGMTMQSGSGMHMQNGGGMPMQNGGGMPMQNGAGVPMQNGGGMTMQNGGGMTMQNGGGMTMQNGGGMTMQNGAGLSLQNGASMPMQGGTGQTPEQLMIQPIQMHQHMGMHMVPHGLQNMHPVSVMQPGAQSWATMNRAVSGNVQMQGNEAAMAMGNSAGAGSPGVQHNALMGGGSNPNGQNVGAQTGMPSGMQTGMPGMQTGMPGMQTGMPGMQTGMAAGASSGMSQMGVGGMSPDMQQMQGQYWPMGSFASQNVMQGNQFAAYPYSANMNGGAAADTQLAFSMLSASTPKPAANVVTTAAPAGGKGAGSTPYPKIAYIDNQKFKDGMINWKDVADALVQIGRVLNWMVKFNYMQ